MSDGIQTPEPVLGKALIPQDLHERGWAKPYLDKQWNNETAAEFFKKHDNAEALLGKKGGIPAHDASPEEWDGLFGKLRAEKPEDYEVGIGDPKDEKLLSALRASFHGAGIHKGQAAKFQALLKPFFDEQTKAGVDAQAALDAEFETITKATFGDETKSAAAIESAKATLKQYAPANLVAHIDKLDNNSLALLIGSIAAIKAKYAPGEDSNNGSGPTGGDAENLRAEARKLIASKEFLDPMHLDNEKVRAKVEELYKKIGAASK